MLSEDVSTLESSRQCEERSWFSSLMLDEKGLI
jgi:hypothetical protein